MSIVLIGFLFSIGTVLVVLQFRVRNVDVRHLRHCYHGRFSNDFTRYSTLDNVDGKQARRTGTSSGLGELFESVNDRRWIELR